MIKCEHCNGRGSVQKPNPRYPHGSSCPVIICLCPKCKGELTEEELKEAENNDG